MRAAQQYSQRLPPHVVTDTMDQAHRRIPGAEDLLWQLLHPWFLGLARSLLAGDAQRLRLGAEDLVHEAFLRVRSAYLRIQGLRRGDLRALVIRVMRRVLIDESRRKLPRPGLPDDGVDPSDDPTERQAALVDLCDRLDCLARCNGRQREIVDLHVFEGLTFEQIERRLGCSASWARKQFHEAIGRMQAMDGCVAPLH